MTTPAEMFNHQGRKYAPKCSPVPDDSTLAVQPVVVRKAPGTMNEATWPQPCAKIRVSKGNKGAAVVRAVRPHTSPQPASLESLEAVWSERARPEETPRGPESTEEQAGAENGMDGYQGAAGGEGLGGPPPRNRKKRFRPPNVRTIFSPEEKDPRVKEESGEGHSFGPGGESSWCDVCCRFIFEEAVICSGCKYTCHAVCQEKVLLDCHPAASSISQDHLNNNTSLNDVEKERELRTEFSREEIGQKIEQYNTMTKDLLKMTLAPTGVYTGFIKVQMDLRRPVTVRGAHRGSGGTVEGEAFYLPRGAINTLHISSKNTVKQVIMALLNKFTVTDNPAKYALYKRYQREEQVYVCKLADGEQPLFLRLVAGPDDDTLSFVLREQQTGEVMWDAFSIPELQNFLRILDKEEEEQRQTVVRRYEIYRQRLQEALREVRDPS